MPPVEGHFLYQVAYQALALGPGLEIGSYCGLSALYLGAAARIRRQPLFTVDHHRGSLELQPGWEHHDPALVDPQLGAMNSLPFLRHTLRTSGLTSVVLPIVGNSQDVAAHWLLPLSLLFVDGGHAADEAHGDYEAWVPHLDTAGTLMIHDVFPDPTKGGSPPYEIYLRALADGFRQAGVQGSMCALVRET
jgi:MMP 1-O-methyltransferase